MRKTETNKILLKMVMMVILAVLVLPTVRVSAADGDYAVLAPLPGIADNVGDTTTLEKYLPQVFNILIGLSAVTAVLMIVIGGFQYMSSDAIQGKSAGKERIKNAIYGLVLVISAWLILYTINPNLLEINLNIDAVTTTSPPGGGELTPGGGTGTPLTPEQLAADTQQRAVLKNEGITVNHDPCTGTATSGCTNVNDLAETTKSGLKNLSEALGCTTPTTDTCLLITGGTEGGHTAGGSHDNGTAVDVSQANSKLNAYIVDHGGTPVPTSYGPVYTMTVKGQTVTVLQESNPPHLHITFK